MIRKINKSHPEAFTIVTGCYAQLKPNEIADIEGVDLILGAQQKAETVKHIENLLLNSKKSEPEIITTPVKDVRIFSPSCSADDRTRHFLKVQDGCDYFCTYCTIPFARGRSRNGSISEIVRQAESVAEKGGKEIVLTGVNIGDFGKSTSETFIDLLRELDKVSGIERYRISSIEPELLTNDIITFVAESRSFMPHFHIPLQSGSDDVLRLMRRHYDTTLFIRRIENILKLMPDAFIGVDVIVGMRGETDEFFNDSREFIEKLPVSQLHVFNYSERPNTKALNIEPAVAPKERHERSKQLLEISDNKLHWFYEKHLGEKRKVLFEHARKGDLMYGFTDNYIKIEINYDKNLCNEIREVKLIEWSEDKTAILCEKVTYR
jgi:threonylcarbamoyladenosine tRNA methylthiotransferase MtaB